jgi:hypothetical protein
MNDEQLEHALAHLGIDRLTARTLAALPLVQVAWADGSIQQREADTITRLADERFGIGEEGALLLQDWLKYRPSNNYFELGLNTLQALSSDPEFANIDADEIIEGAKSVAKAAGGLFGFYSITGEEASAIASVAKVMSEANAAAPRAAATPKPETERMTMLMSTIETLTGVLIYELEHDRQKHEIGRNGLTVGANEDCNVTVDMPNVKPLHCRLYMRRRKFYIEEKDGPIHVNSEQVGTRRLLGGEKIKIGDAVLTFKMGKGGA